MRSWSIVAAVVGMVGCGSKPSPAPAYPDADAATPTAVATPAPGTAPTLAAALARLPRAIDTIETLPIEVMVDDAGDLGMGAACWRDLRGRVRGYYHIAVRAAAVDGPVFTALIAGDLPAAAIAACRVEPPEWASRDPRIVATHGDGFFPWIFVVLDGNLTVLVSGVPAPSLALAAALAAESPTQANLLGRLATLAPPGPNWRLVARDLTKAMLGVPSLGARVDWRDPAPDTMQVTVTVLFADAATAARALHALEQPDPHNLFSEQVEGLMPELTRHGTLTVRGETLTYRGTVSPRIAEEAASFESAAGLDE